MKTKLFFDTEFTGLHQNTSLISIGIISEDGRMFYAEFTDYKTEQCDDWIKENVIKKLYLKEEPFAQLNPFGKNSWLDSFYDTQCVGDSEFIKERLQQWILQFGEVEMWSDCLSYDWVLFSQLWGHAFNVPKNIYYIPFDICTLFKIKEIDPDISREDFTEKDWIGHRKLKHNALWDAKIIRLCYNKLMK